MNYYKVILLDKIIDVLEDIVWVRENKYGVIVACEAEDATGVVASDSATIWHLAGMPEMTGEYDDVTVVDISETEANTLKELLGLGGDITDTGGGIDVDWYEDEPVDEPVDNTNLEGVKQHYIEKLSATCQSVICAGVDVELADGDIKHFDLQIEDQLNLITMSTLIASGQTTVPYHASGELCRLYSAADMMKIIATATEMKTYHTTYFNSLKNWVMSMDSIDDVCAVRYGDPVPEAYCSDVLKQIMAGGNSGTTA